MANLVYFSDVGQWFGLAFELNH